MELWLLYAIGAAVFAALTTILAKIGLKQVDSHLATVIKTVVVLLCVWGLVFWIGSHRDIPQISSRTWIFLTLSGLSTGGSWLCYFRALQLGTVSNVAPLKKSSTILTVILAILLLGEPLTVTLFCGIVLMSLGTYLMLDRKKKSEESGSRTWFFFALLAALFASMTAIFGAIGIQDIEPNLGVAIRTIPVLPMSVLMVGLAGSKQKLRSVDKKSWLFLLLSALATGGSWLLFYRALQIGNASFVVPIDKLSIVLTIGFARVFFGDRLSMRRLIGLVLLVVGTLLPIVIL